MSDSHIFRHTLLFSAICLSTPAVVFAQVQQERQPSIEEVMVKGQIQPYRGGVPLEDTPQAVQVMSEKLLADIGISQLSGALDLSGSVARQNNFGGLWDAFAIRGFAGDENLPSGYLINGFSAGRGFSGVRDSANIEKIEILKGPGSALYGRSEPGGTVNLVTKKPQFERSGYVMASAGTYNTYRVEADYTDAISDSVAFRINGSYDDADSFRDTLSSQKYSLTPSVVALLSEATTVTYELELINQEIPFDRGIAAIDGDPAALPPETFLGEPSDGPMDVEALGHQLMMEHELQGDWKVIGALGYRESSFSGFSSDAELAPSRQQLFTDGETLNRQRRFRNFDATDTSGRVELSGSFDTGGLTHNLLVGGDAYIYEFDKVQLRWRPDAGDTRYTLNVFDPVYGGPKPELTPLTHTLEEQDAWGVYIQDQVDLSEKWKMLVGARFDDFGQDVTDLQNGGVSSQSQSAVNPRAGLVYEISPMSSLYASYSEGFRPNSGSDFQSVVFDPETSISYEVGAKLGTADGRISSTIALFRAEKSNILTADPANPGFSAALGEAESQGIEIDVSGELTDNLALWFSYAFVDAETTNDVINADWGVNIPAGTQLLNVPEHSASLSLVRDFTLKDVPASVGISANYVDDRAGEFIDPSYRLPAYTLVKLFSSYEMTDKLTLRFEIDNLLDEEYFPSSYSAMWTTPGEPRTFAIKARYQL